MNEGTPQEQVGEQEGNDFAELMEFAKDLDLEGVTVMQSLGSPKSPGIAEELKIILEAMEKHPTLAEITMTNFDPRQTFKEKLEGIVADMKAYKAGNKPSKDNIAPKINQLWETTLESVLPE